MLPFADAAGGDETISGAFERFLLGVRFVAASDRAGIAIAAPQVLGRAADCCRNVIASGRDFAGGVDCLNEQLERAGFGCRQLGLAIGLSGGFVDGLDHAAGDRIAVFVITEIDLL